MKNLKLLAALFALFAVLVNVNSGQNVPNEKVVTDNIINSLGYEVEGIVEVSIYNTIF